MKQLQRIMSHQLNAGKTFSADELVELLPPTWPAGIPFVRVWTCGLLAIETLREVRYHEGSLVLVYEVPEERQMQRKGSTTALNLLKLLVSQPGRFATKDWLLEKLHRSRGDKDEWGSLTRFDNVASLLRGCLCPPGLPGEEKVRKLLVEWITPTPESGSGYRLASFPYIWLDVDAMGAHVRQALALEEAGQAAFSSWSAAYAIGKRGLFLSDALYSDWAVARREEIEGYLWQTVQALWRLHIAQKGEAGQREALQILQEYWLWHIENEQALLPLLSLLGKCEEYQLVEKYYKMFSEALAKTERPLSPRIEESMSALRIQQSRVVLQPYTVVVRPHNNNGLLYSDPGQNSTQGYVDETVYHQQVLGVSSHSEIVPLSTLPIYWSVPYLRNALFTGREDILIRLHCLLNGKHAVGALPTYALCGLGGIGKTQTVLEYAYRYGCEYQAVFWLKADSRENLIADLLSLGHLLALPEREARDQAVAIAAIKRWLQEHIGWLLIFDNADNLDLVREMLPTGCQGHVLLTTRAQAMGRVAYRFEVEEMNSETGSCFLLRRAGIIEPDASLEDASERDRALAKELVQELGGLPLALDQAGAYIEETASGLQEYLDVYHTYQLALLQRRGGVTTDHPESVATTWTLAFIQVENGDPVSASLLHLCAFLDPDSIPEELLFAGMQQLSNPSQEVHQFRFHEAIGFLLRFSLIRRNGKTRTVTIHRLIQSIVRDSLPSEQQVEWKQKVVSLLSDVFPSAVEVNTWPLCEGFLPHALLAVHWIGSVCTSDMKAAALLNAIGYYLNMRARFDRAKPLFEQALHICEQTVGEQHAETAQALSNLAYLYHHQDEFEEAMHLLQRSHTIRQHVLGTEHPDTATSLNALALLYRDQGRYAEAEPFFQQALAIRRRIFGIEHPQTAHSLSNLAWLYRNLEKYDEAELLYEQSLMIRKRLLGIDHPDTATSLNGLALLYTTQKKYAEAEPLFQQALAIRKQVLGTKHPHTAQSMNALALFYRDQGAYEKAECLFLEALSIREQLLGGKHPRTAISLHNLALLYYNQGKFEQAESLFQRALLVREHLFGQDHPRTQIVLNNLLRCQKKMK